MIIARYATIGTVMFVDIPEKFLVSYASLTIHPLHNLLGKYLFYYMKSSAFEEEVKQYINENTQGNIGKASLSNAAIVIPPIDLQQMTIMFLNKKCTEIDSVISDKQRQLSLLDSYKKSLIYEYVTGKKEVPSNE